MIRINNFNFKYSNGLEVIKNLNLHAKKNEFLCILGPNGCGKTTLLNSIAGFLSHNGAIQLGSNNISYVFQNNTLFPWLNVKQNLLFGMKNEKLKKELSLLKKFDLEKFRDKYPHELSEGMKRKVEILRALMRQPEIILMDEPFSSLDAQSKMLMHEFVKHIQKQTNATFLFITHDIDEAITLGNRILVMKKRPSRIIKEIQKVNKKNYLKTKKNLFKLLKKENQ